jgi:hypothetical protein
MQAQNLSQSEQQRFLALVEQEQKKEFSASIVGWTATCFAVCCTDFTSRALSEAETVCIKQQFEKQTEAVKRMGLRFAEQNVVFGQDDKQ